jgi:hypothetical protein
MDQIRTFEVRARTQRQCRRGIDQGNRWAEGAGRLVPQALPAQRTRALSFKNGSDSNLRGAGPAG